MSRLCNNVLGLACAPLWQNEGATSSIYVQRRRMSRVGQPVSYCMRPRLGDDRLLGQATR